MNDKKKGLITRVSTAVFFVIVMLGGLYGGRYSFVLLFALINALCLWEFYGMVLARNSRRDKVRRLLGIGLGLTPFLITSVVQLQLIQNQEVFVALFALLFFPLIFLSFIYELYSEAPHPFTNIAYLMLGVIYISVPFSLLDFIAFDTEDEYFYADTVMGLLLMTWTMDTAAYIIGSRLGRTPLFPRISPKKTWEGTMGAALVTLLLGAILSLLFRELQFRNWMALAAIVIVFGSIGDLVESMLKRSMQVKDSGALLPGHGGLLDRFDAFIFLLPYAAAYLLWIR